MSAERSRGSVPRITREVMVSEKAYAWMNGLVAEGLGVDELLCLLRKPWEWEDEYLAWLRRGEDG